MMRTDGPSTADQGKRWRTGMKLQALFATLVLLMSTNSPGLGQPSPQGQAMLQAAERGDVAALRQLIAAGAPVDPLDEARRTPLLMAVARDHLDAARALIDA